MKKLNLLSLLLASTIAFNANARQIDTNIGVIQAMDKITGRVSTIEMPVGGNVSFGDFEISLKSCKTTPPEEAPENFAFVNIVEKLRDNDEKDVFSGWMISSSPALHDVQHPVYDVWLIKCINGDLSKFEEKKEEVSEEVKELTEPVKTEETKKQEVKEIVRPEPVKTESPKEEKKEVKKEAKEVRYTPEVEPKKLEVKNR